MTLDKLFTAFSDWFSKTADALVSGGSREWCTLGAEKVDRAGLKEHFERRDQNKEYVKRYNETDASKKEPYTYLQTEIDVIASTHRCMTARVKNRMAYYKDEAAFKSYYVPGALGMALGHMKAEKRIADKQSS